MDLDSLWLGIRCADAGITTMYYVTVSSLKGDLSMHLWSSGRKCRFLSSLVTLEVCW